ncbi:putative RNA-binding protein 23 [Smittium mucronatum]|uniref:Putative RNA-binding protein 23 n=1 Tax=Smittium mucronatum TaxID=133383 RepID=A0A1R0GVG0_9FUNG|nr:putative RNA-binding protein 23 [Smittium mucronatum]
MAENFDIEELLDAPYKDPNFLAKQSGLMGSNSTQQNPSAKVNSKYQIGDSEYASPNAASQVYDSNEKKNRPGEYLMSDDSNEQYGKQDNPNSIHATHPSIYAQSIDIQPLIHDSNTVLKSKNDHLASKSLDAETFSQNLVDPHIKKDIDQTRFNYLNGESSMDSSIYKAETNSRLFFFKGNSTSHMNDSHMDHKFHNSQQISIKNISKKEDKNVFLDDSNDINKMNGESLDKDREKSPVLTDIERDQRTVFVMQLARSLRTRELIEFFSKAGSVRSAKIISDRASRRSKGQGWICGIP